MAKNTRMKNIQANVKRVTEAPTNHSTQFLKFDQTFEPQPHMIVDIPKFSTDNVIQWLYKVERFFRVYFIPDDQKVSIALFQFNGKEPAWFRMLEWSNRIPNWYSLASSDSPSAWSLTV
ncbi:hypothetical protein ACSQ67_009987 [Phaseolus vulgaris]